MKQAKAMKGDNTEVHITVMIEMSLTNTSMVSERNIRDTRAIVHIKKVMTGHTIKETTTTIRLSEISELKSCIKILLKTQK
jgi:predicted DNA binding CopG/RHH family protein